MKNKVLILLISVALLALAFAVLFYAPPAVHAPASSSGPSTDERAYLVEIIWEGIHRTDQVADCAVWGASLNAEVRRGGGGVVMTQTVPISATIPSEPGTGIFATVPLSFDCSELGFGDYELFMRLELSDGEQTFYGRIQDAGGHDGEYFFLVDKWREGEVCYLPLVFRKAP